MPTNLRWKKGWFSNLYKIYSDDKIVGKLKSKMFSQTTKGELNGKEYTFKTKGFFKQSTEIIDDNEKKVIGKITYNNWNTKAIISVNNKNINWKYDNLWNTKWSIFDTEGINLKYSGSSTSGQVNSNSDDELLLLSGLFIVNYYWKIIIAVVITVVVLLK